jgi:hypothetical protein
LDLVDDHVEASLVGLDGGDVGRQGGDAGGEGGDELLQLI